MRALYPLIDRAQRLAARSAAVTRLAALVRNQCNCVIGYRHAAGADPRANGEQWLLDRLAPAAATFADVGANVGRWSADFLAAAGPGCRGLLFEPSAAGVAELNQRFAGNPRAEVIAAAVGDRPGELTFSEEPGAGETSSLVPGVSRPGATRRTVPVHTIDEALAARGWDALDVLKIDTEGYDLHVLRGAGAALAGGRVRAVQFEYNDSWAAAGSTLAAALGLLAAAGYVAYTLRPDGLYRPNPRRFGEYFRYSNYVALRADADHDLADRVRGAM